MKIQITRRFTNGYIQQKRDFCGYFVADNYSVRHTTGHNMFDPDSFITGEELDLGLTYSNSARAFPDFKAYHDAVTGAYTPKEIAEFFPRVLI